MTPRRKLEHRRRLLEAQIDSLKVDLAWLEWALGLLPPHPAAKPNRRPPGQEP